MLNHFHWQKSQTKDLAFITEKLGKKNQGRMEHIRKKQRLRGRAKKEMKERVWNIHESVASTAVQLEPEFGKINGHVTSNLFLHTLSIV